MTTPALRIDSFEVEDDRHERIAIWRDEPEAACSGGSGGEDMGRILISLHVDGMYDIVEADLAQTDSLTAMNEAIVALTRLRDAIAGLPIKRGRCTKYEDTGRCQSLVGEPCSFPTEEEMHAEIARRAQMRQADRGTRAPEGAAR